MPPVSAPVNAAALLANFMTVVQTPTMTPTSTWNLENPPSVAHAGHHLLGSRVEPAPTWPGAVGTITATNVFYILHSFAVKLTRHRQSRAIRATSATAFVDLGYALTSYANNNTIWFDFPDIPAVGTPMTAADMNDFLLDLRAALTTIKSNTTYASDVFGTACHSSCHSSCHGSRGRR